MIEKYFASYDSDVFLSEEEVDSYLTDIFLENSSSFYLDFSKKSLRVVTLERFDGGKILIRISKEDEKLYDLRPSTDGGVLLVPKAQMDLFEKS